MNIEEAAKKVEEKEWVQIFGGKWSLLTCSYLGYQHSKIIKEVLGYGINDVILISKKGFCDCYYDQLQLEQFGKELAKEVIQNYDLISEWSKTVREDTVKIHQIIAKLKKKLEKEKQITKEDLSEFLKIYDLYVPKYVSVKQVANFLPEKVTSKVFQILSDTRKFSESVYVETEAFKELIAEHISKGDNYPRHLILSCLKEEFEQYFENKQLPHKSVLNERFNISALIFANGKRQHFFGEDAIKIESKLFLKKKSNIKSYIIKGMSAYKGKVQGRVKIIIDPNKADEFREGDILVTPMTRPEFLQLMKKASAIVTDAGGIMSHAAIVARELCKPCIVGTDIATKILKDDDIVEVDADSGIVKIMLNNVKK